MKEVFMNLAYKLATQDVDAIMNKHNHMTRETHKYGRLKGVYHLNEYTLYHKDKVLFKSDNRNDTIQFLSKLIFNQ